MSNNDFDDASNAFGASDNPNNPNNPDAIYGANANHAHQRQPDALRATPADAAAPDDLEAPLAAIHGRILADSARWRASLPPLDRLKAQVDALSAQRREQLRAQRQTTTSPDGGTQREDHRMSDESGSPFSQTIVESRRAAQATRAPRGRAPLGGLRGALAVIAAVLVVALLAAVLFSLRDGHAPVGANSAPTVTKHATPTASAAGWQTIQGLYRRASEPVIAPSEPQVVYSNSSAVANGASLQRSANQGASWQPLPMPNVFPAQDSVTWEDLFVSPLGANTVYAMASLTNPSGGAVNCPQPYTYALAGSHTLAGDLASVHTQAAGSASSPTQRGYESALGGVVPCEPQVVSVDGGQHWRLLTLPFGGRLGNANASLSGFNGVSLSSLPPQAQGSRLYSYADNGYSVSATGYRLATSVDGGLTWQTVDGALVANGLTVCWYAATPTGSTVYAVAATSCDPNVEPPQSFWRSDDAGATWRQVNMPHGVFTTNLALSNTQTPRLYLMAPHNGVQGHSVSLNVSPSDIYTSANGGQTWQALPTKGIPDPTHQYDTSFSFVALADGTLVAPFIDSDSTATPATTMYYSWRPGADWKQLPSPGGYALHLFLINSGSGGKQTIELLNNDLPNSSQPVYSVYTLTVTL